MLTVPLRQLAWVAVRQTVRWRFPSIPSISTATLADWLHRPHAPVLLDVRDAAEFAMSHIPTAYHTPTIDAVRHLSVDADTPIVTYCSVGYRSAQFAKRLRQAGFSQVMNLEGSIFQWANEGRSLVRDGSPVRAVHPYSWLWRPLLASAIAAQPEGQRPQP